MALKNSEHSFGLVSKLVHSFVMLIVFFQLTTGFFWQSILPSIKDFHLSLGLILLLLGLFWIAWQFISPSPKLPFKNQPFENLIKLLVKWGLLIGIILQPIIGLIMVSYYGQSIDFFSLFSFRLPVEVNIKRADLFSEIHEIIGIVILVLVLLHVFGLLKHLMIDKFNILKRMW